jgi:hypothetical protein
MTGQFALAYYPGMQFDFKNVKIKRSEKEKMKKFLLEYLVENPQVLKTEKKRYKEDQYCRYEVDLDPVTKALDLSTIKVLDDKANIAYNLKIIDFLRMYTGLKLTKKNEEKPIEIGFKYLAF